METTNGRRNPGVLTVKWVAVLLLALLTLGAAAETVEAKPSPASYQNSFNKACRDRGGTTKRVGSRVVRCTLTDGTTITCDFKTDPPTCVTKAALTGVPSADDSIVPAGDLVAEGDSSPQEPTHRGGARSDSASAGEMAPAGSDTAPKAGAREDGVVFHVVEEAER